jgi:hypothetical protein
MKKLLIGVLVVMAISLIWISVMSSLEQNVMIGFDEIFATSWGIATIMDLYIGLILLTFIAVISEPNKMLKFIWVPIILFLGNFGALVFIIRILYVAPAAKWKDAFKLKAGNK